MGRAVRERRVKIFKMEKKKKILFWKGLTMTDQDQGSGNGGLPQLYRLPLLSYGIPSHCWWNWFLGSQCYLPHSVHNPTSYEIFCLDKFRGWVISLTRVCERGSDKDCTKLTFTSNRGQCVFLFWLEIHNNSQWPKRCPCGAGVVLLVSGGGLAAWWEPRPASTWARWVPLTFMLNGFPSKSEKVLVLGIYYMI